MNSILYRHKIDETCELILCQFNFSSSVPAPVAGVESVPIVEGEKKNYRDRERSAVKEMISVLLKNDVPVELNYDENGKPFLVGRKEDVSISHSRGYVAVLISGERVGGIDIELMSERIRTIQHRFLHVEEIQYLKPESYLEMLYIIWCAKETMYKIYSLGGLDFKTQMKIEPFIYNNSGKIFGTIARKDFQKKYQLLYERQGDIMLVYGFDDPSS